MTALNKQALREELDAKLKSAENNDVDARCHVAELQAKCAALAAENAGLKSFGDKLDEMHNDLNGEGTGIQGRAEVACQQVALEAAMEEFDAIKTPATDAFLAEVRAAAVDEVCLKISNAIVNCYQDEMVGLDEAATICGDFASELRKGVQP
ncbi:hypothetical protein [Citrobacter freundii]|uniref:hypothetical protein n=1 Tax=Citrobacter freundii TaxID=546 RepID=UPI00301DD319